MYCFGIFSLLDGPSFAVFDDTIRHDVLLRFVGIGGADRFSATVEPEHIASASGSGNPISYITVSLYTSPLGMQCGGRSLLSWSGKRDLPILFMFLNWKIASSSRSPSSGMNQDSRITLGVSMSWYLKNSPFSAQTYII